MHTVAELVFQNGIDDEIIHVVGDEDDEVEHRQPQNEHGHVHELLRGIQGVEHGVAEVDRGGVDARPHERPEGEEDDIGREKPPDLGQDLDIVDQNGMGAAAGLGGVCGFHHALTSSRVSASVSVSR